MQLRSRRWVLLFFVHFSLFFCACVFVIHCGNGKHKQHPLPRVDVVFVWMTGGWKAFLLLLFLIRICAWSYGDCPLCFLCFLSSFFFKQNNKKNELCPIAPESEKGERMQGQFIRESGFSLPALVSLKNKPCLSVGIAGPPSGFWHYIRAPDFLLQFVTVGSTTNCQKWQRKRRKRKRGLYRKPTDCELRPLKR